MFKRGYRAGPPVTETLAGMNVVSAILHISSVEGGIEGETIDFD